MNADEQEIALSEIESLEYKRRVDVAYAVIPVAVRIFHDRTRIVELSNDKSKTKISFWAWAFFWFGFVLHFLVASMHVDFNFGTVIFLIAGLNLFNFWEVTENWTEQMRTARNDCDYQLSNLEVVWRGATGYDSFREIGLLELEDERHLQSEKFRKWWNKQTLRILERVCGREKAESIPGTDAQEKAETLRQIRRSFPGFPADLVSKP